MIKDVEIVRNYYGKIIGRIETDSQGNKTVRNFYGKLLGKYNKKSNITRDLYGRIVSRGDASAMLLHQ